MRLIGLVARFLPHDHPWRLRWRLWQATRGLEHLGREMDRLSLACERFMIAWHSIRTALWR